MKKRLFLFAILLLSQISFAQSIFYPYYLTKNSDITDVLLFNMFYNNMINAQRRAVKPLNYHHGYVVANKNDTLRGNIRLRQDDDISIIIKRSGLNIDTLIRVSDTKLVRLFDTDSLLNNQSYTDYVRIGKNKNDLWRQVYKGDFEIYDELYSSNENPGKIGDYIVVKENEATKTIAGFWTISPKRNMVEYVNQKYDKNFKANNFNSKVEIINWLKLNG